MVNVHKLYHQSMRRLAPKQTASTDARQNGRNSRPDGSDGTNPSDGPSGAASRNSGDASSAGPSANNDH